MPVDVLWAVRNTVWASPRTVLAICRRRSSAIGFRFCGMMLLMPVSERSSRSHGAGSWYWTCTSSLNCPTAIAEMARAEASSVLESTDDTWLAS